MATENALKTLSRPASGDLSAAQYKFVKMNSSGQMAVCSVAGEESDGVLQDMPAAAGRAGCMAIGGQTKVLLGGTVAQGASVATDASGRAVTAATGNVIIGRCTEGGTVGTIGSIIFDRGRTAP
jgi:hypothetical protein